ncbi:hypothetical protein [Rhizobium skierniewicense]|uniref:hypothetical protein n=1 Tax=Rhizobium skierniewicense TaxID=984260 RepID=UPI001571BAE1|nr:hypothetical protein [Rhizobium skierniewicense]NTF34277.1 hypothetical protein [Rhizobium skierniewicense]
MRTIYNEENYTKRFRGIHGLEGVERQFPLIGEILDRLIDLGDQRDKRITALEEAAKSSAAPNKADNNEEIKRALMDAHNALETTISFFRTKAEENKR